MIKKRVFWLRLLAITFFSSLCVSIGIHSVLADDNPIGNGKYRIENRAGEVLKDENGHVVWSKWVGQKSQIWNVDYHKSSYLNPAGYNLTSDDNPNTYIYWDRGSKGNGTKVVVGTYSKDSQYTKNWVFIKNPSYNNTYSIRNGHSPNPYLSSDDLSTITSNSSLSSFIFNPDLRVPEAKSYSLVFTSDPQYPWTDKSDNGTVEDENTKKNRSEQLIKEQYDDVNSYNNSTNNISNIIINGDITAFGHGWQWDKMNSLMPMLNRPYYIGLGNHDIENNQGDSYHDNCFKRSLDMLYKFKNKNNISRNDISTGKSSQSYAIELPGNIFSLQLNNDPTMDYTPTWGGKPAISPNFDWIENQLSYAYHKGYNIIVNVHKPNKWKSGPNERFKNMLKKYDVKAVFAGHYHSSVGPQYSYSDYFGNIPVYLSGSSSQKKYLITEYTDKEMKIYTVTNDNWKNTKKLTSTILFK